MKRLLLMLLAVLALPALAGEAEIRAALKTRYPQMRVEGVQPAPVPGMFEVRFQTRDGPALLYSDANGTFLFVDGHLIDAKNGRNLSEERLLKLTAVDFNALPLDMAVKIQRGNGKRVLAMFTDPYCPYCRRFEQTLLQMDDITVYVFMYPVIRPDNADHSRAVWCSPDRVKAWLELAANEAPKIPAASPSCANPVDKVLDLGRSLNVRATPTLFFANGERAAGGFEIGKLRARLDEIARQPTAKK